MNSPFYRPVTFKATLNPRKLWSPTQTVVRPDRKPFTNRPDKPDLCGSAATITMPPMPPIVQNWLERHRHPASLWLHAIGIPMLVFGLVLGGWQLFYGMWGLWWRPVGLIVVSYILQWIGHRMEGNDMGEVILVKKLFGKPYIAVVDRASPQQSETLSSTDQGAGTP
jgi:hypothetical protein